MLKTHSHAFGVGERDSRSPKPESGDSGREQLCLLGGESKEG